MPFPEQAIESKDMVSLVKIFILLPRRLASYFYWAGPLFARLVVGYVFLQTGWGKLHHLPKIIQAFAGWKIPYPSVMAPFVSGVEFVGGILLILGLLTRFASGALAIVMIVAIAAAKWSEVDSLDTLLGFEETTYLAIFFWLAIAGAGKISLDRLLEKRHPEILPELLPEGTP
jgi:putative oxidoreductase